MERPTSSSLGVGASCDCVGTSVARRAKSLTDETGNDIDVQGGSMVEVTLVGGDKGRLSTAIESVLEKNCGVRAGSEVKS